MINKSIKFIALLFLTLNVYAGGDDRDQVYYENLDEELAAFEAQLAEDLAQAEIDAFKAELEAALAEQQIEDELAAFEAKLEADLAAQEMMAEIEAEMARAAALKAFQDKLAADKAAAAASTAAYQAKLAYDNRVTKIMDDLLGELDEFNLTGEYKPAIADNLIKEATRKLEEEAFVGTISGEIVTEAIHNYCKVNLGLSESNIELFKKALEGDYLGNVGPQVDNGTEFTTSRWQKYIDCVGSKQF